MVLQEEHLREWKKDNFERKKEHYYGESSIQECQLSSLEDNNGHWCIVHFAPKLFSFCFPLPFIFFYYSFNSRITTNKSILFLGLRGPLVEPSMSRPPVHPSTRANFSWVHSWPVTLPSGLRYPSNPIFYESWWCQLSKFGRICKYKYIDK